MTPGGEGTRHRAALAFSLAAVAILAFGIATPAVRGVTQAPDFSLTDVDGVALNLPMFQGKILLLDFMYIGCASCELARPVLQDVYAEHTNAMKGISIDIWATDTDQALRNYRDAHNITWHLARDTDSAMVKYGVQAVVRIFLVDQKGNIIFDKEGLGIGEEASLRSSLESTIQTAIAGTAPPVDIQVVSVFLLAAFAGISSFFSPCSFPMLPGYMAFFLGLEVKGGGKMTKGKAAASGLLSSLGILLVYGIIAAILFATVGAALPYVILLQPIIGVLLIVLGAVMFTAVQYNFLVNPFRKLRVRLFPNWTPNEVQSTQGKLFSYGVGYGAAGFGCVAPPFFGAILGGVAFGGLAGGLAALAVYAIVVVALMVAITVILSVAGQAAVKKMNKYTNLIKKVSAVVLIIAGVYLVYYWWSAYHPF